MKAILRSRGVWLATLAVAALGAGIILAAVFDENTDWEAVFDKDLYSYYMAQEVQSLDEIISDFEFEQAMYLPIAVPDPEFIHFQSGGILPFDPKNFPVAFCEGLVPVEEGAIVMYPITVYEDPKTRDRIVLNAKNEAIGVVPAAKDYDPQWYVTDRYPALVAMGGDYADWLVAMYDPSRIVITYKLILEDDLIKLVWKQSIEAAARAEDEGGGMMKSSWSGGTVTNLKFVAIDNSTNGAIELTIAWPQDGLATNMVDFFACTNLLEQDWVIALTTNVDLSTNSFSWVDEAATNFTVRFYDCWTLDDTDGDGISDGREKRLYGTEPGDNDSDDDALADGTEINVTGTDPLNCDTDGDGLVDGYDGYRLLTSYTNGIDANTNGYVDGEYDYGCSPTNSDSDSDSFPDGFEVACGSDPTNAASFPATLSGSVSYSGGQTGAIHVIAVQSSTSWSETRSAIIDAPGAYAISNAPTLKSYWLKAYRDSNANGSRDAWEAWGEYVSNAVSVVTNTTGLDIALADPDLDGDGMLDWQEMSIVNANTNDAIETVDHVFEWADFDGDGVSNGDEIRLGTDPNNSNSVPPVLRFSAAEITVSEAATNAVIAITLLPAATDTVQVALSVVGGTANNGTDYAFTNQIVTFSAAETNRNIDVPIFVDGPGEPTESIVFRLGAITGSAAMGTPIQTAVWITDSFADSDSDGLPDVWEIQFFGNLAQGAGGDPDGDGVNNLTEFRQGRHPMAGAVADTNNVLKLNVITPLR